jgi:hypothetical protein
MPETAIYRQQRRFDGMASTHEHHADVDFGLAQGTFAQPVRRYTWSTWTMAASEHYVGDGNGYRRQHDRKPEKAYSAPSTVVGTRLTAPGNEATAVLYPCRRYIDATRCITNPAGDRASNSSFSGTPTIAPLNGMDLSAKGVG